jgi:hypothetical protein
VASERVRAEPKLRLAVGTLVLLHTGLPCSAGSAGHPGAAAGDSCARGVLSGPMINRPIAMAHRSLWPLNCVLWSSSGMYLAAISQRAPRAADAAHGRVHTPEYSRNPTHTVAHSPTYWPFHALTNSPSHSDRAAWLFRWRFGRSFGKPTMCARRALGMRCAPTAPMAFGWCILRQQRALPAFVFSRKHSRHKAAQRPIDRDSRRCAPLATGCGAHSTKLCE